MTVRRATEADLAVLRELWEAFSTEIPEPDFLAETWEEEGIEEHVRDGTVLVAEEKGRVVGFAEGEVHTARLGWLRSIYVLPETRRQGVAKRLLREFATVLRERGVGHLGLEVTTANALARSVYERLGFFDVSRSMAVPVDELEERLGEAAREPSFGRIFAQTDNEADVERAVRTFVPRLGRSARTVVGAPQNGWIEVEDELCSRDPKLLRRLAQEISYRTGGVVLTLGIEEGRVVRYVLFDRGSVADEYASVPEYYGPLPPGDVIALGANPTVAHRLTGADPERLRAVARTASSPGELSPPGELYAQLAEVLGVGSRP